MSIDSLADIEGLLNAQAPLIAAWTDRVIEQLDQAVISGTVWLDPGAIIVSGALPLALLRRIAEGLSVRSRNRSDGYRSTLPMIHASSIGSRAVVIGAAMIPVHAVTAHQAGI
ncbi:Uncharacterised protein [Sphingomonas paucimobilis]|nr:Uncharacterised protein [Sphingomonas paucimobilis]